MSCLEDSHFWIHMLKLPPPTIVHIRFNDNRLLFLFLCVYLFYYCRYYFSLVLCYLVLLFIKWLYNERLNFSFCKYISSHPTSIYSKVEFLPGALMFTLSISLNKFLIVEVPGTKHLTYLVIVDFTFKTFLCALYIYIYIKILVHKLFEKGMPWDFFRAFTQIFSK